MQTNELIVVSIRTKLITLDILYKDKSLEKMLVEEVVGKFKGENIYISMRNLPSDCFTCGFVIPQ